MSAIKDFSREEIISIENGDFLVSDAKVMFINFEAWLDIRGTSFRKLVNDIDQLNSKVTEFMGFINRFNRDNATITLLPVFIDRGDSSTFHGFYNIDLNDFDANYNYIRPTRVISLKEFMNQYLFSISMSATPYNTATHYDFKAFIKAIQVNLNMN